LRFQDKHLFRCATRQPVKQKQRQEGKMGRSSACDITALAINTPGNAPASFNAAFQDRFNVVRLGLNYRFGEAITPASFASD
jgi:hypothetical protein